ALCLELTNAQTEFPRVPLTSTACMTRRFSAIVGVEINRELAEDAHRQVPELPADFHWHIENQQTVNAGLIATRVALKMNVKRVAVAGVIIDCRRQLEVNVVGKSKSRSYLPRQHEG